MAHRYFTNQIQQGCAVLTEADATHLFRVLRVKAGDALVLCDGAGMDYEAEVMSASADKIECKLISSARSNAEPTIRTSAFIGYAKGDKLEWAIQKLVELGITEIVPFFSENCVVKPKKEEEKNKRYNKIALEAAKQSGRGIIPKVGMPLPYKKMLEEAVQSEKTLFLYEKGGVQLSHDIVAHEKIAIITGAEGGFTPAEVAQAVEAGCVIVGLGPRILRCETAPIAALTAVMVLSENL